ncbi:MAG: glycosyl hydrolase 53 family protein [Prevotella sp.]|nr:glycosyl hydrolase 53 family protein [Prevotella sp.]
MKLRLFYIIFLSLVGMTNANASAGDAVDWYLYFYSDQYDINGDVGQFVETGTPDVFLLRNCQVTASGINFCIHNKSWSTSYGWSKGEEGIVKEISVDVPLGITSSASGWLEIEAGTYNVTFNSASSTIRFDKATPAARDYLRGGDISMLNYVEDMGAKFYTASGMQKDPLDIMKENGVNFVRLRLYNNPGNEISYTVDATTYNYKLPAGYLDETDILNLARRAKDKGMKIELTFHYSDFWTNGETQFKPSAWKDLTLEQLKTAVYDYTYDFLQKMNAQGTTPDYVSIGNEIQAGLLFGHCDNIDEVNGYASNDNMSNVAALLNQGSAAVRALCPKAKVIMHLTLSENINTETYKWFFDAMRSNNLDYDIIGTSYYPYWTNQRPTMLTSLANTMYNRYGKELLIMEVGYSWTQYRPSGRYGGNYEGQLHLNGSAYNEATEAGQESFMQELHDVIKSNSNILGYLYWDPVMVEQKVNNSWIKSTWAFKKSGNKWYENGNMVGNTTWFDYEGKALPILKAIREDKLTVMGDFNGDGKIGMPDVMFLMNKVLKGKFPDEE